MKPKGRHPDRELTAVTIKNAKKSGRYADGNGLYLMVDPSGAKRWVQRILVHGRRRDIGLGSLTLVTLGEAREEALRLRKVARAGGDPIAERNRARRVVPIFEVSAKAVHAERIEGVEGDQAPRAVVDDRRAVRFPQARHAARRPHQRP
jgi:hypothetical protein